MIGFLLGIPSRLKLYAAAVVAAALGALAVYGKGRSDARHRAEVRQLREDSAAHERINHADLGTDASDDERRDRLREFAARHGNRPAKGKGR